MATALPAEDSEIQGDCSADGRGCQLFGGGLVYSCDYGGVSLSLLVSDLFELTSFISVGEIVPAEVRVVSRLLA